MHRESMKVSPTLRWCHTVVKIAAFVCGIDLGGTVSFSQGLKDLHPRAVAILGVRVFAVLALTLFQIAKISRIKREFPLIPSSNDIIAVFFEQNCIVVFVEAAWSFWTKNDNLRRVFAKPTHARHLNVKRVLFWFACETIYTFNNIVKIKRLYQRNGFQWHDVDVYCAAYVWQLHNVAFILYQQGQFVICGKLDEIRSQAGRISTDRLLRAKFEVRELTARFNQTFQRLMLLLCAKVFAQINRGFATGLRLREVSNTELATAIIIPCIQIGCLVDMACTGTDVIDSCQETDWIILSESKKLEASDVWKLSKLMQYYRLKDSFNISNCFIFDKNTFLQYLGAVSTCVTVLQQFDYRIMARFDQDKKSLGALS